MLNSLFVTKVGMSQAWTKSGKRLPVTKCRVGTNVVVRKLNDNQVEIGFGTKKAKNMSKPLKTVLQKGGFSNGVAGMAGVTVTAEEELKPGTEITASEVLSVGDIVKVQGTSKGRGFAGGIKRHGFHGGPKTHGQSDRERAVGSIGAGTTPGRVWKGKKMPGHYGVETKTVSGLTIVHIDEEANEVWLSGPVPGHMQSIVRIIKTGKSKDLDIHKAASGIKEKPKDVKESDNKDNN